jgi:hypothetical protein
LFFPISYVSSDAGGQDGSVQDEGPEKGAEGRGCGEIEEREWGGGQRAGKARQIRRRAGLKKAADKRGSHTIKRVARRGHVTQNIAEVPAMQADLKNANALQRVPRHQLRMTVAFRLFYLLHVFHDLLNAADSRHVSCIEHVPENV